MKGYTVKHRYNAHHYYAELGYNAGPFGSQKSENASIPPKISTQICEFANLRATDCDRVPWNFDSLRSLSMLASTVPCAKTSKPHMHSDKLSLILPERLQGASFVNFPELILTSNNTTLRHVSVMTEARNKALLLAVSAHAHHSNSSAAYAPANLTTHRQ